MSKSLLWHGGQVSGVPLGRRMLWQRAGRGICPCASHRRRAPCSRDEAVPWGCAAQHLQPRAGG